MISHATTKQWKASFTDFSISPRRTEGKKKIEGMFYYGKISVHQEVTTVLNLFIRNSQPFFHYHPAPLWNHFRYFFSSSHSP